MAMSRTDFWAIANAVKAAKERVGDSEEGQAALVTVTRELTVACAAQYRGGYGFQYAQFKEACGFPDA